MNDVLTKTLGCELSYRVTLTKMKNHLAIVLARELDDVLKQM
jgi:hypothetical protein